jgi:protein-disulfide isomerase
MRFIFILIASLVSFSSQAETAVERFKNSGGEVVKSFDVDGFDLIGLVLKSSRMPDTFIAYTNTEHEYLLVGALMQKYDNESPDSKTNKIPMILDGLYSGSQAHYDLHVKPKVKPNVKVSQNKAMAIKNGVRESKDKYNFLDELVYIGEGNSESPLTMYVLYDASCGYCKKLHNETRDLLDKYYFKWVPVSVVGTAANTATDLVANNLFSQKTGVVAEQRHIDTVLKNTKIIGDTGFIERATPTAIIFDPLKATYKMAAGITASQMNAFYNYTMKK